MAIPYDEKLKRWKLAYNIYTSNNFSKEESDFLCKTLILRCVELINEGIVTDQKQAFRSNRDLKILLTLLLSQRPKFTPSQKKVIRQSLENFKVYCIIKVQGMKS